MKKVLIIYKTDKGANSIRAPKIKQFLEQHNYEVDILNLTDPQVPRASKVIARRILIPKILRNCLYLLKILWDARKLAQRLNSKKYHAIISELETIGFSYLFLKNDSIKILDSPSPFVAEWQYSGDLSKAIKPLALKLERQLYSRVDALSFHWSNYTEYVRKYIYDGSNVFTMNWGCEAKDLRAKYSKNSRIIFLGKLDGY